VREEWDVENVDMVETYMHIPGTCLLFIGFFDTKVRVWARIGLQLLKRYCRLRRFISWPLWSL
jgi:hypothetical protein